VAVPFLEAFFVQHLPYAGFSGKVEVILAFRADIEGIFGILAENSGFAAGAFEPQSFRDATLGAS
jgi:hypothetical protein